MAKRGQTAPAKDSSALKARQSGEKSPRQHLNQLAEALLVRHLQQSWPEPHESVPRWFKDGKLPRRYEDSLRTIAVVGAGASVPMMSIGDELADELEEDLDSDSRDREVELDRLENVYGLDRSHFETRLTALCRTQEAERKVRQRISERYRHRHPSLFTYEVLAHFLHHRFLDAIISFNFDELLDQAIDDELGPNEYARVVTERDCDISVPNPMPLYIKMHGTASEPDSLRFTRERYYWIPQSIIELVEKQFEVEHLVLMNLGFTMASFDFQYLLRKPRQLQIYNFDLSELKAPVTAEITKQRKNERERQKPPLPAAFEEVEVADFTNSNDKKADKHLPTALKKLVKALETRCKAENAGPAAWRSMLRHEAVVKLLEGSQVGSKSQYANYLRRRTILEFAFAAARSRGVLSIASMVDDRCGRYYDLYQRTAGTDADSWQKLCMAGGLEESVEWPDTYDVLPHLRSPRRQGVEGDIHDLQPADARKLAAHATKSMNIPLVKREANAELLTDTLRFLQRETEIEVHSRDDRVCSKIFAEPVILKTFTALKGWTQYMLETTDEYNEVWAISETGKWLLGKGVRNHLTENCKVPPSGKEEDMPVRVLAAFRAELNGLQHLTQTRKLRWGRHNRHMTILCKDGQPRAAIYYVRRLRTPTVTPVYLSNQKDLKRVVEAFNQLWDDAAAYEDQQDRQRANPTS